MVTLLGPHRCTCIVASYKYKTFAQQYNPQKPCQHTQRAHTHVRYNKNNIKISNVLFERPLLKQCLRKSKSTENISTPTHHFRECPWNSRVLAQQLFTQDLCFFYTWKAWGAICYWNYRLHLPQYGNNSLSTLSSFAVESKNLTVLPPQLSW